MKDTIYYNGILHTMAGRDASALVERGGRIAMVGTLAQAQAFCGARGAAAVDMQGGCMLPGFVDSHMHLCATGAEALRFDLRGASGLAEIICRGRAYRQSGAPRPGGWLCGEGYDDNRFAEREQPSGATAEAISTEEPVLLERVCGHIGAANRAALRQAGFAEDTVIPGGSLDRDSAGRLTGVVREAALDRLKQCIPPMDAQRTRDVIESVGAKMAAAGLTAVHSDDLAPACTDWAALSAAVAQLAQAGRMPLRIYEEWEAPRPAALQAALRQGARFGAGSEWLKVVNIKLITDGSLGARTAYLREGYTDAPAQRGIAVYTQAQLDEMTLLCQQAGLPVAFHAIGDGALERCILAVERAQQACPRPSLRHRIVHCQIGDAALYRRMAAAGLGADIQPAFLPSDAPLLLPRLGAARTAQSYAWRTLLECGIPLGGGSDSPVERFDPLWGIYCAVTRQAEGTGGPGPLHPAQRLSIPQAAALYTTGPAWLAHEEQSSGTLEPGKRADFVLLDRDLFAAAPEEILQLRVLRTVAGGRCTYLAAGQA